MANIKNELNNIKSALYGKDVRGSIHDGIDAINKEVESTTGRQVDLENTFDQLIINAGNSNAEIVDARVKNDGTSYSKLGDRLDAVDSQLEHNTGKISALDKEKINRWDLISIDQINKNTGKFDQTFLTDELLQQIAGDVPINSVPADSSITTSKLANGIEMYKFDGIKGANLYNKFTAKRGYGMSANGTESPIAGGNLSDYIPLEEGNQYYRFTTFATHNAFYDADKNFISRPAIGKNEQLITIPTGAKFMKLIMTDERWDTEIIANSLPTGIESYGEYKYLLTDDCGFCGKLIGDIVKEENLDDSVINSPKLYNSLSRKIGYFELQNGYDVYYKYNTDDYNFFAFAIAFDMSSMEDSIDSGTVTISYDVLTEDENIISVETISYIGQTEDMKLETAKNQIIAGKKDINIKGVTNFSYTLREYEYDETNKFIYFVPRFGTNDNTKHSSLKIGNIELRINSSKIEPGKVSLILPSEQSSVTAIIPSTLATKVYVNNEIEKSLDSLIFPETRTPTNLSEIIYMLTTKQEVNIACFGDSMTFGQGGSKGYPQYLQERLREIYDNPNVNVFNYGVGGHSSQQGITQVKNSLKDEHHLCIVKYGINDASSASSKPVYNTNQHKEFMREILNFLIENEKVVILASSTPVFNYTELAMDQGNYSSFVNRRIRSMSLADKELAQELGVVFCDVGQEMLNILSTGAYSQFDITTTDEVHFKNLGYALVAGIFLKESLDLYSFKNTSLEDKYIQIPKTQYVITDGTTIINDNSRTGFGLCINKDGTLGTKIIFTFWNEIKDRKLVLVHRKSPTGGIANFTVNGTSRQVNFNNDSIIDNFESILLDNIIIGYNSVSFDISNLDDGEIHVNEFKILS